MKQESSMRAAIAKQVGIMQRQVQLMSEQLEHLEQLLVLLEPDQPELPGVSAPAAVPPETLAARHAAAGAGTEGSP